MSKPSHMALERIFMDIAVWKKTGRGWQSGLDVNPSNLDHLLHYRWRYTRKFSICNFNRSVGYLQRRRVPITQTSKHYHSMRWRSADVSFWLMKKSSMWVLKCAYVSLAVCGMGLRVYWQIFKNTVMYFMGNLTNFLRNYTSTSSSAFPKKYSGRD